MSSFSRVLKHLFMPPRVTRKAFPAESLKAIEFAVRDCESRHAGEIRVVVQACLPVAAVKRGMTPRASAIELFSKLRVWDTEYNSGVLIYILLADRAVEIVADRGVASGTVIQADWDAVCRLMEQHFSAGRYADGTVAGVHAVADVLATHAPGARGPRNELPDAVTLIA